MNILTGTEAQQVGFTVKNRLKNFIAAELRGAPYAARYRRYEGVDVILVQEREEEVPSGKPLVSLRSPQRVREAWRYEGADGWLHEFTVEARVMADSGSGGLMSAPDVASADESLSDDLEDLLTRNGAEERLSALGIENLSIGPRKGESDDGVHTNRHTITFVVAALP